MRVVIFHVIALLAAVSATKADANDSVESICRVDLGGRRIIENTQGSYMTLNITQDGRKLSFDILVYINILPVTSVVAKQVQTGLTWRDTLSMSTDEKRIV